MAKKRQNLQADKMLEQSNKRFKLAEEGENANIPIPIFMSRLRSVPDIDISKYPIPLPMVPMPNRFTS